jgi:N-acetylglucosaminyldiphosphoundecaprenol N-acetyl-beta-D-mannosaminyltransferase
LLRYAAKHSLSVFLLGGKRGVAEQAQKHWSARIPSLNICGTHHGYFDFQTNSPENQRVLQKIKQADPDLLFVCLGSPQQERWIMENTSQISHLRLAIGLGGALDVWSGTVKRAPKIIRICGAEWLWRTLQDPKRIGRLRYLPIFLWKSILES